MTKENNNLSNVHWSVTVTDFINETTMAYFQLRSEAAVYAEVMAIRFGYAVRISEVD